MTSSSQYGATIRATEYSLEDGCAFTNHGSYGFVPKVVEAERQRLVELMNSNPDRFFRIYKSKAWLENLKAICEYLGLPFEQSVFVDNTTTGINDILSSFPFQEGDRIITTNLVYGAMHYACESIAAKYNLEVVDFSIRLPIKSQDALVESFDAMLQANGGRVRLVILEAIASFSALRLPLKQLIAVARRHNVSVIVDGAHTCGHLTNEEVRELFELADFFVASLHKWLYTARPVGLLSVRKEYMSYIRPAITSWGYSTRFNNFHNLFCGLGTKDYTPFFTMQAALRFRKRMDALEVGGISRYNSELVQRAADELVKQIGTSHLRYCLDDNNNAALHCPFMREVLLPPAIQSWLKLGFDCSTDRGTDSGSGAHQVYLPGTNEQLTQRMAKFMAILYERFHVVATIVDIDTVENSPTICVRLSTQIYSAANDFERLGHALLETVRLVETKEIDNL